MRLQKSTDWTPIEITLSSKCRNLTHSSDVRRMIRNIGLEVSQLSKAEVLARTGRSNKAQELLVKINEDIETVEGFLLVAALLG